MGVTTKYPLKDSLTGNINNYLPATNQPTKVKGKYLNWIFKSILNLVYAENTYKAQLTQSGVDTAPVASVNVDTLGGNDTADPSSWSYNGVGTYRLTQAGAFPDAKKISVCFGPSNGTLPMYTWEIIDENTIEITTVNPQTGFGVENDLLVDTPITIEVFK